MVTDDEPWGSNISAANSPINALRTGVQQYANLSIPASKIVMGLPWYGWDFPCSTNDTGAACHVVVPPNQEWYGWATQVDYSAALRTLADSGSKLETDNASVTRYFTYTKDSGSVDAGRHQLWYDDPVTLQAKCAHFVAM